MTRYPDDTWTCGALKNGDMEAIRKRALDEPGYLEARDHMGDTPLLTAIAFDDLQVVQFLLRQGADPNIAVDDGYTCLLTAVESDAAISVKVVATLVAAGADIHMAGIHGMSPLHMAAAHGHCEKAQLLIDAGANVNQRKEIDGNETPLMLAAFSGQATMVQLLLDNGADAALRDTEGDFTPLQMAQSSAAGPDPDVYEAIKKINIQIDVDTMFDEIDLPPDQLARMKENARSVDLAETYLQNSTEIARSGNHADVIRILIEHAARR